MREIIFRGKREDNGEWVYGLLVKRPSAIQIGDHSPWYIDTPPTDPDDSGVCHSVDPTTVGQYTGYDDAGGVKIFEGDIIRGVFEQYMVAWKRGSFVCESKRGVIQFTFPEHGYYEGSGQQVQFVSGIPTYTVKGNIHDNLDILEPWQL